MENLIVAGISLLILIPILYFIPIGFTLKGKVLIAVASFLIGLIGIGASLVIPLWQTGLILLLLVFVSAYLLIKQGTEWLYLPEVNQDPFFVEEKEIDQHPVKELNDTYSYIAFSDKTPKSHGVDENKRAIVKQKSVPNLALDKLISNHELDMSPDHYDESEVVTEILAPAFSTVKTAEIEPIQTKPKIAETVVEDGFDLDIEELGIKGDVPSEVDKPKSSKIDDSYDYMAEVEKMIEVEELNSLSARQEENAQIDDLSKVKSIELDDEFVLEELVFTEKDSPSSANKPKIEKDEKVVTDDKMVKQ